MHINELELSVRAHHALKNAGIETVEQLAKFDWRKFAEQNGAGVKTIAELAAHAVRLASGEILREAKKWDETAWEWKKCRNDRAKLAKIAAICSANSTIDVTSIKWGQGPAMSDRDKDETQR